MLHSELLNGRDIQFLKTCFKPKFVDRQRLPYPAYEFYRAFLNSRLQHALLSARLAERIIKTEDSLSLRRKTIQKDYLKAALFMDLGRSIEATPMHKMPLFKNHGMESALILQRDNPLKSLNVVIPVMMHDQSNPKNILMNPEQMKALFVPVITTGGHILQNREGAYENAQFWAEKFRQADMFEQQTALEGIKVLKDADKCAQLLEIENIMSSKNLMPKDQFSPEAEQAFMSGKIVKVSFLKTIPDMALYYLSFLGHFHYRASLQVALSEKTPEKITQHFLRLTFQKMGHPVPTFPQKMQDMCALYIKKLQTARFNQLQQTLSAHIR